MILHPDFTAPRPPTILPFDLPEAVRPLGLALSSSLEDMTTACNEVGYSLALFDLMEERVANAMKDYDERRTSTWPLDTLWAQWRFMAARYGGLAVRNYGQALGAVAGLIGRIPGWEGKVDKARIGQANKRFAKSFATIDKLRHAVAHPEFYADPNKDMSIATESGGRILMRSNLEGRELVYTFKGKHADEAQEVRYELSVATLKELIAITNECFRAFQTGAP